MTIMMRTLKVAVFATLSFCCYLGCSSDSSGGSGVVGTGGSAGSAGSAGATECGPTSPAPGTAIASCNNTVTKYCTDYTGSSWTEPGLAKNICGSGTYADAPCATANLVGSCQQHCGSASEVVIRYYDASTDWKKMCENQLEGKWLNP